MNNNFSLINSAKTLEKLFKAGFDNDKKILSMQMEDLEKIANLTSNEAMIIIEYKRAVKNRKITEFLSGNKEES